MTDDMFNLQFPSPAFQRSICLMRIIIVISPRYFSGDPLTNNMFFSAALVALAGALPSLGAMASSAQEALMQLAAALGEHNGEAAPQAQADNLLANQQLQRELHATQQMEQSAQIGRQQQILDLQQAELDKNQQQLQMQRRQQQQQQEQRMHEQQHQQRQQEQRQQQRYLQEQRQQEQQQQRYLQEQQDQHQQKHQEQQAE